MRDFFFFFGRAVCHQIPERSFVIDGNVLPLCARCTGIYLGVCISFLYLILRKRWMGNRPLPIYLLIAMAAGFVPLMLDGFTSYIGLRPSNNGLRLFTGTLVGYPLPFFMILVSNFDIKGSNTKPILKKWIEIFYILLSLLLLGMSIYHQVLFPWWFVSGMLSATILFGYIYVFFIVLKQILPEWTGTKLFLYSSIAGVIFLVGVSKVNQFLQSLYR